MKIYAITFLTLCVPNFAASISEIETALLAKKCDEAELYAKNYSEGNSTPSLEEKLRKSDLIRDTKAICSYLKKTDICIASNFPCENAIAWEYNSGSHPYYFMEEHYFSESLSKKIDTISRMEKHHNEFLRWIEIGLKDSAEISKWSKGIISYEDSRAWVKYSFTYSDAVTWRNFGINPKTASEFRNMNLSPEVAVQWNENYLSGITNVSEWIKSEITPLDAKKWALLSSKIDIVNSWKNNGFSPDEAIAWSTASFVVGSMSVYANFSPKDAKLWKDASYQPNIAAKYSSLKPNDAISINNAISSNCKSGVKDMSEIWIQNPYDTKGNCYECYFRKFQLLDKKSGLFVRADQSNSDVVKISTQGSSIAVGEMYGVFKSIGVYSYINTLGAKQISVHLMPVKIIKNDNE